MRKTVATLTLLLGLVSLAEASAADEASFRLVVSRNDAWPGGELHVDVEMAIANGTSPRTLNSLTFDITYTSGITGFVNPNEGVDSWGMGGSSQGYVRTQTRPDPDQYRLIVTGTSVGTDSLVGTPGFEVTYDFKRIATLKWIIFTATDASLQLSANTTAAAYFENINNDPAGNVIAWAALLGEPAVIMVPLDATVPVELTQFGALASDEAVHLSWGTETETNNLGFHAFRSDVAEGEYKRITEQIIRGAGTSAVPHHYSYTDRNVQAGATYHYKLADIDFDGIVTYHGPVLATILSPKEYILEKNYPNPFNPNTSIRFSLQQPGKASLQIFDIRGRLIRTLVNDHYSAGHFTAKWDGTNENGTLAASGIYLYRLEINGFRQFRRMALLK